jgi:uncharacterized membrane protein
MLARDMAHKILILLHLVGFAAYIGAGFAQQQFMKKSAESGLAAALRDEYERLAWVVSATIEGPAIGVQFLTGTAFLVMVHDWLSMGWLHAKLGCVFLLVGLTHAERANARKIVAARKERGDAAAEEIASRKARHAMMGTIGTVLVVVVLALVAYGTA